MDALDILKELSRLKESDGANWNGAVDTLVAVGAEAVPFLMASLINEDPRVALGAVKALAKCASPDALRAIGETTSIDSIIDKLNLQAAVQPKNALQEKIDRIRKETAARVEAARVREVVPGNTSDSSESLVDEKAAPPVVVERNRGVFEEMYRLVSANVRLRRTSCFILCGPADCGKTYFLSALAERVREDTGVTLSTFSMSRTLPVRDKTPFGILMADWLKRNDYQEEQLRLLIQDLPSVYIIELNDLKLLISLPKDVGAMVYELNAPSLDDIGEFIGRSVYGNRRLGENSVGSIVEIIRGTGRTSTYWQAEMVLSDLLYRNNKSSAVPGGIETVERDAAEIRNTLERFMCLPKIEAVAPSEAVRQSLRGRIIGQDRAIDAMLPYLVDPENVSGRSGPAGVFLFFGPTGCGKTETARALADAMFQGRFHKEDMNTYGGAHMSTRITGSPPGYIGYGHIPPLLKFIEDNNSGVILFDEIEKAHPAIYDQIMELLDTGWFRDAAGVQYDARRFIIVMTSNAACRGGSAGFGREPRDDRERFMGAGVFRPEFLGRIHAVVKFDRLDEDSVLAIASGLFRRLVVSIGYGAVPQEEEEEMIRDIAGCYDERIGARSMRSYVEIQVRRLLLERMAPKAG